MALAVAAVLPSSYPGWTIGLAASLLLAALGLWAGAIDLAGALAGTALATLLWAGLGPGGFFLLALFVVLGSAFTRVGYARKRARGIAQAHEGRRGAGNALANCGVAALASLGAASSPRKEIWVLAAAGALATALADTTASELGQVWGRRTRLLTTWRPVPAGTEGAVSSVGTLAALLAAAFLATCGAAVALYPWAAAPCVALAGFLGCLADSLLGATLETRGVIGNEGTNALATLVGAGVAAGLEMLI